MAKKAANATGEEAKKSEQSARPLTKKQLIDKIAQETGLTRKDVDAVLDSITGTIAFSLSKKGTGAFVLPGILKIVKKRVPAKKKRKDVKNPFTGELRDIPAKPAHDIVKVKALKGLKGMI